MQPSIVVSTYFCMCMVRRSFCLTFALRGVFVVLGKGLDGVRTLPLPVSTLVSTVIRCIVVGLTDLAPCSLGNSDRRRRRAVPLSALCVLLHLLACAVLPGKRVPCSVRVRMRCEGMHCRKRHCTSAGHHVYRLEYLAQHLWMLVNWLTGARRFSENLIVSSCDVSQPS